ncbi:MAG: glycerol kinase, partial [Candidatus Omnitrophica bacterium]|nr:glycerol kinase [Candidatus Omnitrophota bacterium]
DMLGRPVWVSDIAESTAWGTAKLAGKVSGVWRDLKAIDRKRKYHIYRPKMGQKEVSNLRKEWKRAVQAVLHYSQS